MANVKNPLNMAKVYREIDEGRIGQSPNHFANQCVHEFMRPLIARLSAKHPHWEFVSDQNYSSRRDIDTNTAWYARFNIVDDGDVLGWINCESRHHGMTYCYENHRLSAKRSRGQCNSSVKIDVAYKSIVENFYGLTIDERLNATRSRASSMTQQAVSKARQTVRIARDRMVGAFEKFAERHWDQFVATLNDAGKGIAHPFREQKEIEDKMIDLDKARSDGRGVVVAIKGDSYLVGTQAPEVRNDRYDTDTLPAGIKGPLGILKLCEVNVPVPGIGMRMVDNQFLVIVEKEEE